MFVASAVMAGGSAGEGPNDGFQKAKKVELAEDSMLLQFCLDN